MQKLQSRLITCFLVVINIQRVILKAHLLIVYIWLNLSLGDVRDVFKPDLAIFLTTDRHWN
ncbi:hypothetical protein [Nostoc sp.]|uniref:hypothetical protein n=1 Tax=Nostoc sp. TaxID=1180 RepID=UPI002FFD3E1F